MSTSSAPTNADYLEKFELVLHTDWLKEELPNIKSSWPTRHTFSFPLVLSTLQLWPLEGEVRLQLQLHGNKAGEETPVNLLVISYALVKCHVFVSWRAVMRQLF